MEDEKVEKGYLLLTGLGEATRWKNIHLVFRKYGRIMYVHHSPKLREAVVIFRRKSMTESVISASNPVKIRGHEVATYIISELEAKLRLIKIWNSKMEEQKNMWSSYKTLDHNITPTCDEMHRSKLSAESDAMSMTMGLMDFHINPEPESAQFLNEGTFTMQAGDREREGPLDYEIDDELHEEIAKLILTSGSNDETLMTSTAIVHTSQLEEVTMQAGGRKMDGQPDDEIDDELHEEIAKLIITSGSNDETLMTSTAIVHTSQLEDAGGREREGSPDDEIDEEIAKLILTSGSNDDPLMTSTAIVRASQLEEVTMQAGGRKMDGQPDDDIDDELHEEIAKLIITSHDDTLMTSTAIVHASQLEEVTMQAGGREMEGPLDDESLTMREVMNFWNKLPN